MLDFDLIQIVSFSLEMVGFSLVFIEIFRNHLVGRANSFVLSFKGYVNSFLGVNLGNADEDSSVPLEIRDEEFRNGNLVRLQQVAVWYLLARWWGPTDGFLAGAGKFLGVAFLGFLGGVFTHYLLILLLNSVVKLAEIAGRGSYVAGVGFVIAALGLSLETLQVLYTKYRLLAIALWFVTLVIIAAVLIRRRNEKRSRRAPEPTSK